MHTPLSLCVCVCVRGWIKRLLTCWFAEFNLMASILMRSSEVTAPSARVRKTLQGQPDRGTTERVVRPRGTVKYQFMCGSICPRIQFWGGLQPDDCDNNAVWLQRVEVFWWSTGMLNLGSTVTRFPQKQSSLQRYWPFFGILPQLLLTIKLIGETIPPSK